MVISNNTLSCILKYPFIIIFGFELYCRPQYTKTAGIAAMAGGSLLICTLSNIILINVLIESLSISKLAYKLTKNQYGYEIYQKG